MYNKYKHIFSGAFISFALSALSLILMPFVHTTAQESDFKFGYILGGLFWVGFLFGLIFCLISNGVSRTYRKRIKMGQKAGIRNDRKQMFPGIISITLRPVNLIVYAVFVVGLLLIITDIMFTYVNQYVMFTVIAVTFYALVAHCIIDGKNYKIYKFYKGR